MSISRREFIETTTLGGVAASSGLGAEAGIPRRTLGRTGASVSLLGFGCGSRFLMYKEEDKALAALNHALDLGINYVDTAFGYGNGASEERVGKVMKYRRKGVFLVTKINKRKADEAKRTIEGSLKRLQTDHVDLLHVHALMGEDDLAAIEARDGVLNVVLQMREQKVARFIGVTCHAYPAVLKKAIERHDFDCTQMALNAGLVGMAPRAHSLAPPESFETVALPAARRKNMGVTAMKVFAQEYLLGKAPVEKMVRYAMSLPVASAVIGMPKLEHIEQNAAIARNFKPLPAEEMRDMSRAIAAEHKAAMDRFFANHVDG